jgi:hypothetical protein
MVVGLKESSASASRNVARVVSGAEHLSLLASQRLNAAAKWNVWWVCGPITPTHPNSTAQLPPRSPNQRPPIALKANSSKDRWKVAQPQGCNVVT